MASLDSTPTHVRGSGKTLPKAQRQPGEGWTTVDKPKVTDTTALSSS